MTPFVLWLNKNELDELISIMAKSTHNNNNLMEVYSTDELVSLTESLLEQNVSLIQVIKKLTPLKPEEQALLKKK